MDSFDRFQFGIKRQRGFSSDVGDEGFSNVAAQSALNYSYAVRHL
jgi:hypothetical protein